MDMKVKTITGGIIPENCYFILDEKTGKAAVVDPGFYNSKIEHTIQEIGKENIVAILLTHGHFDHMAETVTLKKETGAAIYFPEKELPFLTNSSLNLANMLPEGVVKSFTPDVLVKDGMQFSVGSIRVRVLQTPGHTQGSCCYLTEEAIFTGDTLFFCSVGRTDFPTGSNSDLMESLEKLKHLDGDYTVYPGHEGATTLSYERQYNPYMNL